MAAGGCQDACALHRERSWSRDRFVLQRPDAPLLWAGQCQEQTDRSLLHGCSETRPGRARVHKGDPHVGQADEPYTYAGDDPVNESDPSGLASLGLASAYCTLPYVICDYTSLRFALPYLAEWYVAATQGLVAVQVHKFFQTSLGNRFVDVYNTVTDQITEVKTGTQSGPALILQARKDDELVTARGGVSTGGVRAPVSSAEWDFYPNGSGTTAPSPSLVQKLSGLGIQTNVFFYQSSPGSPVRVPYAPPLPFPFPLPKKSENPGPIGVLGAQPLPSPAYTYSLSLSCDVLA